jgi:hypothetical protein
LEDFAPNFLSKPGAIIHSDRSKNPASETNTPASQINDSGSENRLSELVRLVDKRKRMIQERERNLGRHESPFQNAKSDKVTNRLLPQMEDRHATVDQAGRRLEGSSFFGDENSMLANIERVRAAL